MPVRDRENVMSLRAVHIVATDSEVCKSRRVSRRVIDDGYSNPYSTAMRHASLAFLLGEACCRRERGEEKSSSQAGHECALGVERVDLRGV